jgi:hypothetical protein
MLPNCDWFLLVCGCYFLCHIPSGLRGEIEVLGGLGGGGWGWYEVYVNFIRISQAPMAHACNPSYLGGSDQEDHSLGK